MRRFIVIVLDGFGVGEMSDVGQVRPSDAGSDTLRHILDKVPGLYLPALSELGLMNIAGYETERMKKSNNAVFGRAALMHYGADTFFGHQEIMGTCPKKPFAEPIRNKLANIYDILAAHGYSVRFFSGRQEKLLIVNDAVTVADNIETDHGQAYNVTAAIDDISFDEIAAIGKLVRSVSIAPRVIAFGGSGVHLNNILEAIEEYSDGYIGVNAPKSGVYRNNYHCIHMGYGVNPEVQLPALLARKNIPSIMIGKAADIIQNGKGSNYSIVETQEVMKKTKEIVTDYDTCFICANVQETDLCGHQENADKYADILLKADCGITELLKLLTSEDILVVMADHGNDPTIGHSHHTREYVPLMVRSRKREMTNLGIRATLSDVAATAADYFGAEMPENGKSFLSELY